MKQTRYVTGPAMFGPSAVRLDMTCRKVPDLDVGPNDVSQLAPGVYFIQERGVRGEGRAVKITIEQVECRMKHEGKVKWTAL